jgi:uncharacterized protein (TIGR03084 family)
MDASVAALADQQAELSGLLSGADEAALQRPSLCAGWTVTDVLLHLAQSDELATASIEGWFPEASAELAGGVGSSDTVDAVIEAMVNRQRGASGIDVARRWHEAAVGLIDLLDASDLRRRVLWVGGEVSLRTLATTRLAETWIHTGDVAGALGGVLERTDRLQHIARLAWRTVPYAFGLAGQELSGPVAFELRAPGGEIWTYEPEGGATTTITGDAAELCMVAARRLDPDDAATLRGEGPDAAAVLALVRTYA